jgi:hypothetical protein
MINVPFRVEERVDFGSVGRAGRKGAAPPVATLATTGRIPRVTRLMALAIKFEGLVRSGAVRDYAELARLGRVSRARLSQIMNLVLLAPDLQETLLFQLAVTSGHDRITLRDLQPIALTWDWRKQRQLWDIIAKECPRRLNRP